MSIKKFAAILCLLGSAVASNANAAFYNPFGPQQNVNMSTILNGGWTECYSATMGTIIGTNAENILSKCSGGYLMMAGRATGSDVFQLLAETTFADATFNTGSGTQNVHTSNGSDWYFSSNWSWGFADAGTGVSLSSCDTSGVSGADRMCLHTINFTGGYRIGNNTGLNNSSSFEKVFFVSNGASQADVPEPATIAMFGLGLLGLAAVRQRSTKK
ncbi:hypothetical protein AAKU61_000437 [Undibacterium sp. GrIS 1.2]|uniref:PEP-CTERM sorting domain-containing protein n=1 Tax=Undibacterium sp. GrIS 1.2 TaxID=3143933 RepID=UPI003397FD42